MNIKEIRSKSGLSQKDFGARLGLTSQSITKFEAGGNITETVKKLIRYEFAEYLPEEERLFSKAGNGTATANATAIKKLQEENEKLREQARLANSLQEIVNLQKRNIELLEDQVKLYKEKLNIAEDKSKSA